MGNKDSASGYHNWTGSKYFSPYEAILNEKIDLNFITSASRATATFGGDGVNMENNNGTTLILTNTDGTTVTFTTNNSKNENQSDADEIGTDYSSATDAIATKSFHVAFTAAISAGTLKMTLTPTSYTNETSITLTQDSA